MSDAKMIAEALGRNRRKPGGGFMACCPAHPDKDPSLSIDEKGGNLVFKCFGGCEQEAVIEALKSRGLWEHFPAPLPKPKKPEWTSVVPIPDNAPAPPTAHPQHGQTSSVWRYHNRAGDLLQLVSRFDTGDGKTVLPLTYCTKGTRQEWRWQALPPPRPLYGLETIKDAHNVLVVEGEKTADAARRLTGLTTLTWSGGCNAVKLADWSSLEGLQVIIWPDADQPGKKAALAVAEELEKVGAASVKIIEPPPDATKGWDLADAEAEGWTAGEILEFIEIANDIDCPQTLTAETLFNKKFPPLRWAVPGLFPVGLTILAGPPKIGKSWLVLGLCLAIARGGRVWGAIDVGSGIVLYAALEDSERRLQGRLQALLKNDPFPVPLDKIHLRTTWERLDRGGIAMLKNWLDAHPDCRLVIFDTLQRVKPSGKGRNQYEEDYTALEELQRVANEYGVAVIAIHHLRKAAAEDPFEMIGGSTGLTGCADTLAVLKRGRSESEAELIVTGRDIEEQTLAMKFEPRFGSWQLIGDAVEHKQSRTRQRIFEALQESDRPLSPKEVWEELGGEESDITYDVVRKRLPQMADDGLVSKKPEGGYVPRHTRHTRHTSEGTVTPVTPVTEGINDQGVTEVLI